MRFKSNKSTAAAAAVVMRFAKSRLVAILFAILCLYIAFGKLFASPTTTSKSLLLCDDDQDIKRSAVVKDAYAYSVGTNPVLSRENPRYSSFICFGGEDMECWNIDREFKPYDYTVRYCLFKNVLWDVDGNLVFYQDVNNVPLWDFDHGQTRFQFNAQEYQHAYGVNIRLVNSSLPTTSIERYGVDTVVFAHEYEEEEQQHLSVWSAFQAMASTAMLSLENEILVSSKHAVLSRYWPTLSNKITRKEDFTAHPVLLTHLVLTPINGRALLPHEELARVFQTRAFYLNNISKPPVHNTEERKMRIGVQVQPEYDLQPIIDQLKQRYGGRSAGMDLVLIDDEFTSLREEIAVFSKLDLYILLFPGHTKLNLAFLTAGSIAVLGNTCNGNIENNKPCSVYAKRWAMFPHFAKKHVSVVASNDDVVILPESVLL